VFAVVCVCCSGVLQWSVAVLCVAADEDGYFGRKAMRKMMCVCNIYIYICIYVCIYTYIYYVYIYIYAVVCAVL